MAGWAAHRIEMLTGPLKIVRPAFEYVGEVDKPYELLNDRKCPDAADTASVLARWDRTHGAGGSISFGSTELVPMERLLGKPGELSRPWGPSARLARGGTPRTWTRSSASSDVDTRAGV